MVHVAHDLLKRLINFAVFALYAIPSFILPKTDVNSFVAKCNTWSPTDTSFIAHRMQLLCWYLT